MSEPAPNPNDFSKDEKPGQYEVHISARGTIWMTVTADSEADATAKVEAMIEADELTELDEVNDISIDRVRKSRPMYRVTREGTRMQVSHLEPGDIPREPGEYGF